MKQQGFINLTICIALLIFTKISVGQTTDENKIKLDWEAKSRDTVFVVEKRDPGSFTFYFKGLTIEQIDKVVIEKIKVNNKNYDRDTFNILKGGFRDALIDEEDSLLSINILKLLRFKKFKEGEINTNEVEFETRIVNSNSTAFTIRLKLSKAQSEGHDGASKQLAYNFLPIPSFTNSSDYPSEANKKSRYLIIDANPNILYKQNNVLYRRTNNVDITKTIQEQFDIVFESTKYVYSNGSISVLVKNYNLGTNEEINVSLNGVDYKYDHDIKYLFDEIAGQMAPSTDIEFRSGGQSKEVTPAYQEALRNYLESAYASISRNRYLNINDLYLLNKYKKNLSEHIKKLGDTLEFGLLGSFGKILYWSPEYISLTPIPVEVADSDEINITAKVETDGKYRELSVGTYKTRGGMGINLGSLFYITGLTNNEVYTKKVTIDSKEELHAELDSTNRCSVGIGLNAEVYFRTGSLVKPTINVGFFVPLGQELVPYFAIGPGIAVGNKKVKFSLNGGLALGQVNEVAKRYQGVDISEVTNLTSITRKVWKPNWYVGIGVSFNIATK